MHDFHVVRPSRGRRCGCRALPVGPEAATGGVPGGCGLRHLLVLIFEPDAGRRAEVEAVLRRAQGRAEAAGWHCWAYRNALKADEITLFLEGPAQADGADAPVFGEEIEQLRGLSSRFDPVRSLIEYPLREEA